MTIDEAIKHAREVAECREDMCDSCRKEHQQLADWLEELKLYKNLDLETPQHFTKEQSDWIKKYCIEKNKEFYKQGVNDLKNELLEICAGYNSTYDSQIIYIADKLKGNGK